MKHTPQKSTGPYHDFWIFRAGQRSYYDYNDLLSRKDSPVRIPDDILLYFNDWFSWLTPLNPTGPNGKGFNQCGITIIEKSNGKLFREICESFLKLYQNGPEIILFRGLWAREMDSKGNESEGFYDDFIVEKKWLTDTFSSFAEYGKKVEMGTHFIIHLGI